MIYVNRKFSNLLLVLHCNQTHLFEFLHESLLLTILLHLH